MKVRLALGLVAACAVAVACGSSKKNDNNNGGGTTVSGHIVDDTGSSTMPVAGATVTGGGKSTTSAADGSYTLVLTSGSNVFIKATASSYVGGLIGLTVPAGGTTQADIHMVPTALVNAVATALGTTYDNTKGIVDVHFESTTTAGFGASISATSVGSFTFDTAGNPTPGTATLSTNNAEVIFIGVTPGTTTATVTAPSGHTCTPFFSGITDWQVDADTLTSIPYACN